MYKWVVIGGGIQGSCVASRLLEEKKAERKDLLIIDSHKQPLERWRTVTDKIEMEYLRSPLVHHLHTDPYSLKKYSSVNNYASGFKGRYQRPRLDMFNQHCLDLLEETGVMECWLQGEVNGLKWTERGWKVGIKDGRCFFSERVVLAMGVNHTPHYPSWAEKYRDNKALEHIFEMNSRLPDTGDVIVIGGGMTAGHLAYALTQKESIHSVTMVKRHPLRIHHFDSDPGWLGPKYLNKYHKLTSYKERRKTIQKARNRGSITRDLYLKLLKQERLGRLDIHTGCIEDIREDTDGKMQLFMENQEKLKESSIMLATGPAIAMPGKEWLDPIIKQMGLPCAPCGFPVVPKSLEWKNGLFVAGALAELEIGPVSRNIAGARKAAERILRYG
ncbi:FAD/NAD(P)-binding protein [Oceanobacillus sojae]|uniref:L-lysine N6-monooxygenase MbtG n=1 Tax=Oceanobacillus sojae TaxID=582851 RepID=A0A511ZFH6_9BACI|nr:FAD/NAD(P)-binding protein [Oceanobacillus sojae]GEN86208.1 pyridine nucleotide-disulfide oxidoreductase [Oceanobacillus sojae]